MAYTSFKNGFKVGSASAIDQRILLSKAEMITAEDDYMMPDQYLAICVDNGKLYLFNINNESNGETGKFREIHSDLADVAKSNDYNDLLNKLQAGTDLEISEDNVINFINNSQFITATYLVDNQYATQKYVQEQIAGITVGGIKYQIVTSKEEMTQPGIFYLIKAGEEDDLYDEYLVIEGKPEKIGSTRIDLSQYYTKTEADSVIQQKINESLTTYATIASLNELEDKIDNEISAIDGKIDLLSEKESGDVVELEGKIAKAKQDIENELKPEISKKVNGVITSTEGKALIFNEFDGGGAKFEHVDGTWSYVGVSNHGENGTAAQIYAVNKDNTSEGVKLNIRKDGIYYLRDKASSELSFDDEIVTLGKVKEFNELKQDKLTSRNAGQGISIDLDSEGNEIISSTAKEVSFENITGEVRDNKKLSDAFNTKVDKVSGYSLISDSAISKLSGIEAGAEVNSIETVDPLFFEIGDGKQLLLKEIPQNKISGLLSSLDGKVDKVNNQYLMTGDERVKLGGITAGANKVESSENNGNILINGLEVKVFDPSSLNTKITNIESEVDTLDSSKQDKLNETQLGVLSSGITSNKVNGYDSHISNTDVHVTSLEKNSWNNKQDIINNENKLDYRYLDNTPTIPSIVGLAKQTDVDAAILAEENRAKSEEGELSNSVSTHGNLISGLQESLDDEIENRISGDSTIENKLNRSVITSVDIEAAKDKVVIKHASVNLSTGSTSVETDTFPLADENKAGLESPETVKAVAELVNKVDALEGRGVRLLYQDKSNPTAEEIRSFVENKGYTHFEGIMVVVDATKHVWRYYSQATSGNGWKDDGLDSVSTFTNTTAGIIKGSTEDGKVYAEDSGIGSVVGWDIVKEDISNIKTNKADSSSLTSHVNNGEIHVTSTDKSTWSGKYSKPSTGIPSSDLSEGVISSLNKANSAYQKPSGGIPASDLAQSYYLASNPNGFTSNVGTITGVNTETPLTGSGTVGSVTIGHATTTVTKGVYGDSTNQTPSFGDTFKVPSFTVNEYGHLTTAGQHTVKLPDMPEISDTTYTFTGGTNKFTVTPSEGSEQTVTITPSISVQANAINSSDTLVELTGTGGTNGVSYSALHKSSTVTPGTYGSKTSNTSFNVPSVTVDSCGHITNASNNQVEIQIPQYTAAAGGGLELVNNTQFKETSGSITVGVADWTGSAFPFTATKPLAGVTEDSTPILDIDMSSASSASDVDNLNEAWSKIYRADTLNNGQIRFYATEKPTVQIKVQVKGF